MLTHVVAMASGIVMSAVFMAWLAEIPIRATLRRWKWILREWKRSRPRGVIFTFRGGVELRHSISRNDDPYDRKRFGTLRIHFEIFKNGVMYAVRLLGGGSLYNTIWRSESILVGSLPGILVKGGGFVIVEAEECGQYLVLIEKAYSSPQDVEISAHQIRTPEGVEQPLPDGRIVHMKRDEEGGLHLELIASDSTFSSPADSTEWMDEFHRTLVGSTPTAC